MANTRARIPLSVKVAYTLFAGVLVPVYWHDWGPSTFLWFSDIAVLGVLVALWLESRLVAGMMAVGTILFALGWTADFVTGGRLIGGVGYMFDPAVPLYLRALSLFHLALPALLVWMVHRLGYDRRAFPAQCVLVWLVLALSYLLTDPAQNINWVFGPGAPQSEVHPLLYLALLMVAVPVLACLPAHLALQAVFGRQPAARAELDWGKEEA